MICNVDTRNDLISPLTTEFRFSCLHAEMSDSWTLQIRYTQVVTFLLSPWSSFMLFAQLRDIGEYQCHNYYQISIIIIFNHDDDYDCPVKNIGEYQCHNHYQLTSIIINHYHHIHHDNHDNNYDCLVTRYRGVPMSQLSSIINYHHPNYNPSDNNHHNNLMIMTIIDCPVERYRGVPMSSEH